MNSTDWSAFPDASSAQTLFMTPFFSLIRSRLNTMDELPNSPMLTGTERCSNVLPRPHHGLFIVFAEGVTLKNKNRWSFPGADPLIRAAARPSHLSAFESWSPSLLHANLPELDLKRGNFRAHSGSLWMQEQEFWTVSFPPPVLFVSVALVITLQLSGTFLVWMILRAAVSDAGSKLRRLRPWITVILVLIDRPCGSATCAPSDKGGLVWTLWGVLRLVIKFALRWNRFDGG